MCGIVGIAKVGNLTSTDVKLFNSLLYVDTLRGWDSTGVFAMHKSEPQGGVLFKKAMAAPDFLQLKSYDRMTNTPGNFRALLGHNRAATRGAVSDKNAHPFQHKSITLVHNGTLDTHYGLAPTGYTTIDSEAICHALGECASNDDFAEVIEKLDGAFSLVWHDQDTDYLWFVRNTERPMHWARTLDTKGNMTGIVWASEEEMITFCTERSTTIIGDIAPTTVGSMIAVDLSNGLEIAYRKEVKLRPKKVWGYGQYSGTTRQALPGTSTASQGTQASSQQSSVKSSTSTSTSSAGNGQRKSPSGSQQTASATSQTLSQRTSTTNSRPSTASSDDQFMANKRGYSCSPRNGEYIEINVAKSSFVRYGQDDRQGFTAGVALVLQTGGETLRYTAILHSCPADAPPSGIYRVRVVGRGIRTDDIRGVTDAEIQLYCTYVGCIKIKDDEMQAVFEPRAVEEVRKSPTRPAGSALVKKLYHREVAVVCERVTSLVKKQPSLPEVLNITSDLIEEYDEQMASEHCYGPAGTSITVQEFDKVTKDGCANCGANLWPSQSILYFWCSEDTCLCDKCASKWLSGEPMS